jgi:hypothetical protein
VCRLLKVYDGSRCTGKKKLYISVSHGTSTILLTWAWTQPSRLTSSLALRASHVVRVAQAVNSRLPTAAARVRYHVGFVADKVALGHAVIDYFGFSCQTFYRLLQAHHHHSSDHGTSTIGQIVADVTSRLSLAIFQETKKKFVTPRVPLPLRDPVWLTIWKN